MSDLKAAQLACQHQCVKCGILYACKKIHGSCEMPYHHGRCLLCN
jgi:hypothetical protein